MTESTKSLAKWRHEIKVHGKKQMLRFYQELLGASASSIPRLYKAINLYGDDIVIEAIVASSDKDLGNDPLNYVIAVAKALWKEEQEAQDKTDEYNESIQAAIKETEKESQALSDKLKKLEKR